VSIAGESGIIRIEDSRTSDTTVKSTNGLTFDRGYLSPYFANGNTTITYENPIIFVSNVELTNNTLVTLMKDAKAENKPLIIIAPDFNENIFTTMYKNHVAGAVQICPIKCPGFAGNREQWLEDICIYSGATLYKNNSVSPINNTGNVDKIIIGKNETSLIHNNMRKEVFEYLRLLDKQLDDATEQYEIDNIKERRSRLAGNVVTIYVGATTELELKEKKDRVEDAVCALQTALKGGISEGGGLTFSKASLDLYDTSSEKSDFISGYNLVIEAILKPFEQLCINSDCDFVTLFQKVEEERLGYNFKINKWENFRETGVIDPTLVLKNAITNAIGIASNLLTTNCITYKES
jgi:chaperonin GroEL